MKQASNRCTGTRISRYKISINNCITPPKLIVYARQIRTDEGNAFQASKINKKSLPEPLKMNPWE